jgi:hypothetical protein
VIAAHSAASSIPKSLRTRSIADGKPATLQLAVAAALMLGEQPATDYGQGTAINAEPTAAPQN